MYVGLPGVTINNWETISEPPKVAENLLVHGFWFNVLRATTACTFSTSQRPKVV